MQQESPTVETKKPAFPAKAQKAKALPLYDCIVNVADITRHLVPKTGVTAAEIAVLRAIHANDAVESIEEGVPDSKNPRLAQNEIAFLAARYGPRAVRHVFGAGFNNAIPEALEDLPAEIAPLERDADKDAA